MATDTAPRTRRMYWQLPVFAVGVAAAILAWRYFPPAVASGEEQLDRDRYTLRQALGRRPVSVGEVRELLEKLGEAGTKSGGNADVAFVQGSGYMILAEQGPPEEADENWRRAHALFAECAPAKLTDKQDRTRVAFRAAKAAAGANMGDPAALIPQLDAIPLGEDPGERGRLLAEACLRLSPPNTKRAKAELAGYLSGPPRGTPEQSARLKIKLADLCVATGEPDSARTWLKEITDPVPNALQADAKLRLARLALADGDVNDAVKLFQAADALPNLSADQQALVRYETGRGLLQLGNPAAARDYLKKAADSRSPAGAAAALRLSTLVARDPDPSPAVEWLKTALDGIDSPSEWANPHATVADARAACETIISAYITAGRLADAVLTADVYGRIAEAGRDRELWAETMVGWAASPNCPNPAEKLKLAAKAYEKLAATRPENARPALYQMAATAYRAAGDTAAATEVLGKLTTLPGTAPEVQAAAQLQQAEALLASNRLDEGVKLLSDAATTAGPVGTQATLRLALVYVVEGKKLYSATATENDGRKQLEYAADLLTQLANRTYTTTEERVVHQQALYELGKLQLNNRLPMVYNCSDAETRFRRLVTEYPSGPYADRGTMFLGIALSQLAQGENTGRVPPADSARKFAEARKLFESLGKSADEFVRTQADIRLAHTLLHMKEYEAVNETGTALADKYRGRVEELILLNIVLSGDHATNRPDRVKATFARLKQAFADLPDDKYSNHMPEYTKTHWVDQVAKLKELQGE